MKPRLFDCTLRRSRAAAMVAVASALLTVACGSHGRAIRVGAADSGSQVRLHVGDTLAVDVGGRSREPWALVAYPHSLMALTRADRKKGEFRLLARHIGGGKIAARVLAQCGPPALRGPECPVGPPMVGGGIALGRAFVLTVHIVE